MPFCFLNPKCLQKDGKVFIFGDTYEKIYFSIILGLDPLGYEIINDVPFEIN